MARQSSNGGVFGEEIQPNAAQGLTVMVFMMPNQLQVAYAHGGIGGYFGEEKLAERYNFSFVALRELERPVKRVGAVVTTRRADKLKETKTKLAMNLSEHVYWKGVCVR